MAGDRRLIGKYVVEREIGRGGMGAVYLARHPDLDRNVAIKELMVGPAAEPSALPRFLQEARLMARTSHPNLVQVYDLEKTDGGTFIILEYVDGQSLRERLRSGPVEPAQACAIIQGLLRALEHAHKHQIVHRDVKPENILISKDGTVKVADFGVARLTLQAQQGAATMTQGAIVGTPQYMSPEQVVSHEVDGRSDVYSAGVVAFELFCGRPPFESGPDETPYNILSKHVSTPPPSLRSIRADVDPALERLVLKALAKRPEDRFSTAGEFERALAAAADRIFGGATWRSSLEPATDVPAVRIGPGMSKPSDAPPVVAPHRRRSVSRRVLALAGTGTVLVVAAAAIGSLLIRQPPSGPAACAFLVAGARLAPGLTGSCGVHLGAQLEGLDCARVSTIPADRFYQFADDAGGTRTSTVYPISSGQCHMSVSQQGAQVAVTTKIAPPNGIVIVDFEPTSSEQARIGVQVRCQATGGCIFVDVSPTGVYTISEQLQPSQPLKQTASDTAVVLVNRPNRLVVSFLGKQVTAWLNGARLSSVATEVPPGEGEVVFVAHSLSPQQPMVVNLSRLFVFQAT
jgi:predicted Ser/Thr protein kinase